VASGPSPSGFSAAALLDGLLTGLGVSLALALAVSGAALLWLWEARLVSALGLAILATGCLLAGARAFSRAGRGLLWHGGGSGLVLALGLSLASARLSGAALGSSELALRAAMGLAAGLMGGLVLAAPSGEGDRP
jgi:hypothetical protein